MCEIRKAVKEDIPSMAKLWKALVLEENPEFKPDTAEWERSQERLMRVDGYYVFVAVEDGQIVGFNNGMVLIDYETGHKYVEGGNFYVLPKYRKGTSGMKLHRNSFNVSKNLGAKFLRRHVSVHNKRMVDRFLHSKNHVLKEYIVDEMIGGVR